MLSPDSRTVAFELIRAPAGYRLDFALLTTYTLDLEALLVLPLSMLARTDGGIEELLANPLRLHQALQNAGDRVHVFVDETGIAIPHKARRMHALLESSVHAVRAPGGGAFHPKVWVARFTAADDEPNDRPPLIRVAVLSRNLTFDHTWDVAVASEASPRGQRRVGASRPLDTFLANLPRMATISIDQDIETRVQKLADDAARTRFPAPDGFEDPIEFHALGLSRRRRSWSPLASGYRTLAIAPFVNNTGLKTLIKSDGTDRILVSRPEELDKLHEGVLAEWSDVFVLSDSTQGEPEDVIADKEKRQDGAAHRPAGLHAKMIAVEHGWDVTWYVGSANLTSAAFAGSNVEMMASITGRKGRKGGFSGHGIDRFLEGFMKLCKQYRREEQKPEDDVVVKARARLEEARDALLNGDLQVTCVSAGDNWSLTLDGEVKRPSNIDISVWPISVVEDQAGPLNLPLRWTLPIARLTAFIAFRLSAPVRDVDDIRMTMRLPATGIPEDRMHHVLSSLIDDPQKFLQFLCLLLGGLDSTVGWARDADQRNESGNWRVGLGGDTLLEDLVRTAARDPGRLKPVRRLIVDLRKTEEGRRIVPHDLFKVWTAVEEALEEVSGS
ncbi:MAG: phospholipase D family protein [Bryobacterales bacterium]|nr:phospholipase D family protein [Bryobacterales bacterium]MDE0294361.1 phospholipase D family protein [Bryobacterales bacterium]